jgi:hypothetical protein
MPTTAGKLSNSERSSRAGRPGFQIAPQRTRRYRLRIGYGVAGSESLMHRKRLTMDGTTRLRSPALCTSAWQSSVLDSRQKLNGNASWVPIHVLCCDRVSVRRITTDTLKTFARHGGQAEWGYRHYSRQIRRDNNSVLWQCAAVKLPNADKAVVERDKHLSEPKPRSAPR